LALDPLLTPDEEVILARLEAGKVTLTVSSKRTIKTGDVYHGFESGMSLSLQDPEGQALTPRLAKVAAMRHTPDLFNKVTMDLAFAGVLPQQLAADDIRIMREQYARLLGTANDRTGNSSDVRRTGDDARSAGDAGQQGAGLHQGPADAVPGVLGPDRGAAAEGGPGAVEGAGAAHSAEESLFPSV
jgi:hypothetical protein